MNSNFDWISSSFKPLNNWYFLRTKLHVTHSYKKFWHFDIPYFFNQIMVFGNVLIHLLFFFNFLTSSMEIHFPYSALDFLSLHFKCNVLYIRITNWDLLGNWIWISGCFESRFFVNQVFLFFFIHAEFCTWVK